MKANKITYSKAKEALDSYFVNQDINSGYDIIRYANLGIYESKPYYDIAIATEWLSWGVREPAFIWLRFAKQGYLQMNERNKPDDKNY